MKTSLPFSSLLVDVTVSVLPVFACISVRRNKPERGPEQSSWDKSENCWHRKRTLLAKQERRWSWKTFDGNINTLHNISVNISTNIKGTTSSRNCRFLQKLFSFAATWGDHAENQENRFGRYGEDYCFSSKNNTASGPSWRIFRIHWQVAGSAPESKHILN